VTRNIERGFGDPASAAVAMLEKNVIIITNRSKKSDPEWQVRKGAFAHIWARAENGNVSERSGVISNLCVPERI
jgi:hypothetical protein